MPVPTIHFKSWPTSDGAIQGRHPQHVVYASRFVRLCCGPESTQPARRHNRLTRVKWFDTFVIRSGLTDLASVWTEDDLHVSSAQSGVFGHARGRYAEGAGDLFGGAARARPGQDRRLGLGFGRVAHAGN